MDPEEVITLLIALFGLLGFLGFLSAYIPALTMVPYLFSIPHYLFGLLGGLINSYVAIGALMWTVLLEIGIFGLFCLISYKVGH